MEPDQSTNLIRIVSTGPWTATVYNVEALRHFAATPEQAIKHKHFFCRFFFLILFTKYFFGVAP